MMTPKSLTDEMFKACDAHDSDRLFQLVAFMRSKGWRVWEGRKVDLDGKEALVTAKFDGHCQVCDAWFKGGALIRWGHGRSAHADCWNSLFEKKA